MTRLFAYRRAQSDLPKVCRSSAYDFEDYAVQLKIARDLMQSKNQCPGGKVFGGACGGLQ